MSLFFFGMVLYKIFIKIYKTVGEITSFEGIIAVEPPENSSEAVEFLGDLEFMVTEDLSFKFTTLETYMAYKDYQDSGGLVPFEDLQIQNIDC